MSVSSPAGRELPWATAQGRRRGGGAELSGLRATGARAGAHVVLHGAHVVLHGASVVLHGAPVVLHGAPV
eukprot:545996-Prorocentrum_minimum.AAC.1